MPPTGCLFSFHHSVETLDSVVHENHRSATSEIIKPHSTPHNCTATGRKEEVRFSLIHINYTNKLFLHLVMYICHEYNIIYDLPCITRSLFFNLHKSV